MPTPLSSQSSDSTLPASHSADYYKKIVTTRPPARLRGRHILLVLALALAGGEFLHVRHIRANDALCIAVLEHDNGKVRNLLKEGADPNLRYVSTRDEAPGLWRYIPGFSGEKVSDKSKTLLMVAAGNSNNDAIVGTLLQHGADPNVKLVNGQTALLMAATLHDSDILNSLLSNGANFSLHDSEGHSPLHLAAQAGNINAVRALLDKGVAIDERDAQVQTALCLASGNRHEDVVKLLLERGASLDELVSAHIERSPEEMRNYPGYQQSAMNQNTQPLLWAAQAGSPSLISAVWDKQLNPEERQSLGLAALTDAIRSGSLEAVQTLIARGVPVEPPAVSAASLQSPQYHYSTPLITAAGMHNIALCRLLLENGANVNRAADTAYGGMTPLLASANASDAELVRLLIEHGANINARNIQGETPLMLACNSPSVTQALLAHGADINARDKRGNTALMHTQSNDVLNLLLAAGADAHGGSAETMLLTRATTPKVAVLLIARGAKVDERDSQGQTALMRSYNDDVVSALLEHGADPNAKDNQGRNALHHAVMQLSLKRIPLLIAHGANVNATAANGDTPLSMAKQRNYPPLINALTQGGAKK